MITVPSSNESFIDELVGAIAKVADDRGSRLTKIRLVKFIYLFDLYWAQSEKATFTGWPWAFVHYGPYCRESTDAIDRATANGFLVAQSYESNYGDSDYRLYSHGEKITEAVVDRLKAQLPLVVSSSLFNSVKRWCDDTYGLLDFVYFCTGPMQTAIPGQQLSFANQEMSDLTQYRPLAMVPLSKKKIQAVREAVANMAAEQTKQSDDNGLYDEEYRRFVDSIAGEETATGVRGIARLQFVNTDDD